MNAKQLREAANNLTRHMEIVYASTASLGPTPIQRMAGTLIDHILATARDDDDELIDEAWFSLAISSLSEQGPSEYWYWDEKVPMGGGLEGLFGLMKKDCVHEFAHIKTRGEFRALCRLLGVTLCETIPTDA